MMTCEAGLRSLDQEHEDRHLHLQSLPHHRLQVTNDDGPPSAASSPYILPFVSHLLAAGHKVSICIPSEQRSWIAKAHLIGRSVTASPYTPPSYTFPSGAVCPGTATWITADSTPASCAQLGIHHLFHDIDLVVSGPNYGRNTTAVFALSSGTLGGALEACVAGHRAIALSFAFLDRENKPDVVAGACRHAVKVVEYLASAPGWEVPGTTGPSGRQCANPAGVVYSVNVPLAVGVEEAPTRWTRMLANRWESSCFTETGTGEESPELAEREIRSHEAGGEEAPGKHGGRRFRWAPQFADVYTSVERGGEGSDGWAVAKGQTSITMLRANFEHVAVEGRAGEVKL